MKKTTKTAKTPTPAPKKTAPAPAPKAAAPAAAKKKAAAPAAPKKAGAPKVVASAVAPAPAEPSRTFITAKIDIGFGNALYLRGEGPGLSWDKGTLLECTGDDTWAITLTGATRPVVFKFLVNDLSWSSGPDFLVEAGSTSVITPSF